MFHEHSKSFYANENSFEEQLKAEETNKNYKITKPSTKQVLKNCLLTNNRQLSLHNVIENLAIFSQKTEMQNIKKNCCQKYKCVLKRSTRLNLP